MKLRSIVCILTFTLILCINKNVKAQSPQWAWARSGSGSNSEFGMDVATDLSGNVYVTGYFYGQTITFGNTTLLNSSPGSSHIFIVKYDESGNVIWAKQAGGSTLEHATGIATDTKGNIYVSGDFFSDSLAFDSIILTSVGIANIFIAKFDSSGHALWAKRFGGSRNESGYKVETDQADNVYLTGFFSSDTAYFDSAFLVNSGGNDMFILKLDQDGNVRWTRSAVGNANDYSFAVAPDLFGNVYVAGSFQSDTLSFGNTHLSSRGLTDIFIAKYDSSGNFIWAKGAGGDGDEQTNGIGTDMDGNIYLVGYFSSDTCTFSGTSLFNSTNINSDAFLAKYNSNGNFIWASSAQGSGTDNVFGIAIDATNNIYITGGFSGAMAAITFGSFTLNDGGVFVTRYDTTGNVIWAKSETGIGYNFGYGIDIDPNENLYITGSYTSSSLTFDATTLVNAGGRDVFLAKLDHLIGIEESTSSKTITIYPNPTKNNFIISGSRFLLTEIGIYNILAEKVLAVQPQTSNSKLQTIDISKLPEGIYFVNIQSSDFSVTQKLIITR